jgi:hypothetical protein
VDSSTFLEAALHGVHGLEVSFQTGKALSVEVDGWQIQQLFSEKGNIKTSNLVTITRGQLWRSLIKFSRLPQANLHILNRNWQYPYFPDLSLRVSSDTVIKNRYAYGHLNNCFCVSGSKSWIHLVNQLNMRSRSICHMYTDMQKPNHTSCFLSLDMQTDLQLI